MKYDLILGAEVVHELSHAAGVHKAIHTCWHPVAKQSWSAEPPSRFGVNEFQTCCATIIFVHCVQDVPRCLTHDLESLKDDMLGLQVYTITWAEARKAGAGGPAASATRARHHDVTPRLRLKAKGRGVRGAGLISFSNSQGKGSQEKRGHPQRPSRIARCGNDRLAGGILSKLPPARLTAAGWRRDKLMRVSLNPKPQP